MVQRCCSGASPTSVGGQHPQPLGAATMDVVSKQIAANP